MSTAGVTNEPITEDYSCGYCLQRLPYMEDPRQLPCSHVFCLPCLQKDLEEVKVLQCNICRRQHGIQTLESLPKLDISKANCDSPCQDEQVPCEICTEDAKYSVCYCPDCDKKICEEHQKVHNDSMVSLQLFSGADHTTISIEEMRQQSVKCKQTFCFDHGEMVVTLACGACHQTFCSLCQTEATCTTFQDMKVSHHVIVKLERLGDQLREDLKDALKSLSEKITHICKLEKTAWRLLDDVETKTRTMMEDVDRAAEKQVKEIQSQASAKISELSTSLSTNISEIASYTSQLIVQKESLRDLWRATLAIAKTTDVDVCKTQKENVRNIKEMLAQSPPKCLISGNLSSLSDRFCKLHALLMGSSAPPMALEDGKYTEIGCDIVLWSHDDNLVTGRRDNIQLFNKCLIELKSVSTEKGIMSLIEREDISCTEQPHKYIAYIYTGMEDVEINGSSDPDRSCPDLQLGFYSADFDRFTDLDKPISYGADDIHQHTHKLTVNQLKCQINVLSYKQIEVYNLKGDLQYTISLNNISKPKGICALRDGSVLVSDEEGYVSLYILHPPPMPIEHVWTSEKFSVSSGIDVDSAGFIYVGSHNKIQILSPSGKLLNKLTHQRLHHGFLYNYLYIYDIAVSKSGEQIAIACGQKGLKLFNLSRKELQ